MLHAYTLFAQIIILFYSPVIKKVEQTALIVTDKRKRYLYGSCILNQNYVNLLVFKVQNYETEMQYTEKRHSAQIMFKYGAKYS